MDAAPHDDDPTPGDGCRLLLFVGPDIRPDEGLAAVLGRAGLRSVWLAGAAAALRAAAHARFDAVVLQAHGEGGPPARMIDVLRQALQCPVVVVGAGDDEVDEIVALEFGADAYLGGPTAPRRLRAHVQALLRREGAAVSDSGLMPLPARPPMRLGPWTLDTAGGRLEHGDLRVELTPVQCALLACMGERLGRVTSRDALAQALSPGRDLNSRSVDVYVARLRRRLREGGVDALQIEGVRSRGYALSVAAPMGTSLNWGLRSTINAPRAFGP